jgi:hypothetical protein
LAGFVVVDPHPILLHLASNSVSSESNVIPLHFQWCSASSYQSRRSVAWQTSQVIAEKVGRDDIRGGHPMGHFTFPFLHSPDGSETWELRLRRDPGAAGHDAQFGDVEFGATEWESRKFSVFVRLRWILFYLFAG